MAPDLRLLVTCEHAGNRIPSRYRGLFSGQRAALDSHAGYDIGALAVARDISAAFADVLSAVLVYSTTSRLLVDLNRSVGHRRLHGEAVRGLPAAARASIVSRYHRPYRERVRLAVEGAVGAGARVVHVSCHSFTPSMDGEVRDADVGLLFDPRRTGEAAIARQWRAALRGAHPELRVRLNYPYRGTADGLTTDLRRQFGDADYVGIELEVNQLHAIGNSRRWRAFRRALVEALAHALGASGAGHRTAAARRPSEGVEPAA